jgi:hypothetical protein
MSIETIAERLRTQDNLCTADPLWVVYQKKRIYGFDPDMCDNNTCYVDECGDECRAEDGGEETGYMDTNVFVSAFFTSQAAKDFIERNRHNLHDPFVDCDSGCRNPEWKEIRAWLAKKDTRFDSPRLQPQEWYNEADPAKLLRHLLNLVNAVTCPVRHGNPMPQSRLADLCEAQLRIEEAIGEKI